MLMYLYSLLFITQHSIEQNKILLYIVEKKRPDVVRAFLV